MTKILTPAEVRLLQAPNVAENVRHINETLLRGFRTFFIPKGIADAVAEELELQGWCAKVDASCKYSSLATIKVIEDKS